MKHSKLLWLAIILGILAMASCKKDSHQACPIGQQLVNGKCVPISGTVYTTPH